MSTRTIHSFFLNDQNDFQREQVDAARTAARRHKIELQVRYAESNALIQIHQLYESVHAKNGPVPDAIVVEPVAEEGMARIAGNAAAAGISWATLNAESAHLSGLCTRYPDLALFGVAVDNVRAGEIQGAQVLKLLGGRTGASVLLVQGLRNSLPAKRRLEGLQQALAGHDVSLTTLDTNWNRAEARSAVADWMRLGRGMPDLVVGQNDEVALGARDALGERLAPLELKNIPFLGCDGLPAGGQQWVRTGTLAATVVTPMAAEAAIEALARFYDGAGSPSLQLLTTPESFPPLEQLRGS